MIGRRRLTCSELVELVTEYFDGALSRRDRRRFEAHIAACGGCQRHLEQLRATIDLSGRISEDDLAPETQDELLEAFRGWARK